MSSGILRARNCWRAVVLSALLAPAAVGLASPVAEIPELPLIDWKGFAPAVREQFRLAYEALEENARDPAANGHLGMLFQVYERYEPAAVCYRRALVLDPQSVEWAYYLGVVLAELGRHEEAVGQLEGVLKKNPGYLPARLRLGEALLAAGDAPRSRQILQELLNERSLLPQVHYGLGQVQAAQGELAAAVEHYEKARQEFEGFAAAHYALGLAYRDLGRHDEAREHLARYQEDVLGEPPLEDPLLAEVRELSRGAVQLLARAARLEAGGRPEEALAEHLRILEIDPQMAQAHANLVSLYGRLGRPEKAEEHYRKAVELSPRLPDSHYNFGVLRLNQGSLEEAAEAFRLVLEINPFHAEAHNNLGHLLEGEGKLEEATRHYRLAIEAKPDHVTAHFNLGRILLHEGKVGEAIHHFQKTLGADDERSPGFVYALAIAYARSGDTRTALGYARRARHLAEARGQTELLAMIDRDLKLMEQALKSP